MKKRIIANGEIIEVNIDEALKIAAPHIARVSRRYYNDFNKEDYLQEGRLVAWKVYNEYDITKGASYTTFLEWKLRQRFGQILSKQTTKKRTIPCEFKVVFLDCPIAEDEDNFHDLLGGGDFQETSITNLTFENIMSHVTEREKRLFPILIGTKTNTDLAIEEGITRQNVCNQVSRLKTKLQKVVKKHIEIQV